MNTTYMNNSIILPVILAGGSGERLWPLSRSSYPKQFLTLLGAKHSLFQNTLQRLPINASYLPPIIVCNEEHRFMIAEQLKQINREALAIILEPAAKNTAPAIALAAQWALSKFVDPILLVLPADHYIQDQMAMQNAISTSAVAAAQQGYLLTFGVPAHTAETGYGYIKIGENICNTDGYKIAKFIEKPDQTTAAALANEPDYLWNIGTSLFTAKNYLQELNMLQPQIVTATAAAIATCKQDLGFIRPAADCYTNCPAISIDYAVMEHTKHAAVFKLNSEWSDIGNWQAVWEQGAKDTQGNYLCGDVLANDSSNCLIDARYRLVATLDVHDLTIVETVDAVLIAKRDRSQEIKLLVNELKQKSHAAATEHRQVLRPWGWYDCIAKGEHFQVKHIFVDPGKSLSLQMHHHRSEHWVIVQGSAKVLRGDETFILAKNESTFIPIGMKHQLTNMGKIPLELIEVQSGSYLGEDDIVRFSDDHGRTTVNEKEFSQSPYVTK